MNRNLLAKIGIVSGCLSIIGFGLLNYFKISELRNRENLCRIESVSQTRTPTHLYALKYDPINQEYQIEIKTLKDKNN